MKPLVALALALSLAPRTSVADTTSAVKTVADEKTVSINVQPAPALALIFMGNVEVRRAKHGLLLEGYLGSIDDGADEVRGALGGVGYRYHIRGQMDGAFVGVNASYSILTDEKLYNGHDSYTVNSVALTGNVGRRWQWDNGFNITGRVGIGLAYRSSTAAAGSDDLWMDHVESLGIRGILPAYDGELSVGYSY